MRFDSLLDSILEAVFTVSPGKMSSMTIFCKQEEKQKSSESSLKFCKQIKLIFKNTHQRDNICEIQNGKKKRCSVENFTKTRIKLTLELSVQQYRPPLVPNGILPIREIKRQWLDILRRIRVNYQFSPSHPV